MAFQPGNMSYVQSNGSAPNLVTFPHIDVRAPTAQDILYPVGKKWVYLNVAVYELLGFSSAGGVTTANWSLVATTGGNLDSLTGDSGLATPVGGNINIIGTANQIDTIGAGDDITISLDAAIIAPGSLETTTSLEAGTTLTVGTTATIGTGLTVTTGNIIASAGSIAATGTIVAGTGLSTTTGDITASSGNISASGSVTAGTGVTTTTGDITANDGDFTLGTAGNKLNIATGANASIGTSAAMTAGAITINTTAVTASSIIFVSHNTLAGTPGAVSAPAAGRVAGTSFDIASSSNTDTSTVNWWIIN